MPEVIVDHEKCTGCGTCVEVCPGGLALGVVGAVGNVGTASSSVLFGGSLQLMGTSTVAVLGLEFVKAVLVVSLALLAVVFIYVVKVRRALGLIR